MRETYCACVEGQLRPLASFQRGRGGLDVTSIRTFTRSTTASLVGGAHIIAVWSHSGHPAFGASIPLHCPRYVVECCRCCRALLLLLPLALSGLLPRPATSLPWPLPACRAAVCIAASPPCCISRLDALLIAFPRTGDLPSESLLNETSRVWRRDFLGRVPPARHTWTPFLRHHPRVWPLQLKLPEPPPTTPRCPPPRTVKIVFRS